jgi:hypothetical protein
VVRSTLTWLTHVFLDGTIFAYITSRVPINKKNRPTYDEMMLKPMIIGNYDVNLICFSLHERLLGPAGFPILFLDPPI